MKLFALSASRAVFGSVLVLFLLAAGCASGSPSTRTVAPAKTSVPHAGSWAQASWEDRHDTMTFLVLPQMARSFQSFEGTAYPELTCRSCHGQDAEKVRYAMPNGPPLDPAHLPRKDSADPREAKIAAFMMDEITPALAQMIDEPEVGCFTCHTKRSP